MGNELRRGCSCSAELLLADVLGRPCAWEVQCFVTLTLVSCCLLVVSSFAHPSGVIPVVLEKSKFVTFAYRLFKGIWASLSAIDYLNLTKSAEAQRVPEVWFFLEHGDVSGIKECFKKNVSSIWNNLQRMEGIRLTAVESKLLTWNRYSGFLHVGHLLFTPSAVLCSLRVRDAPPFNETHIWRSLDEGRTQREDSCKVSACFVALSIWWCCSSLSPLEPDDLHVTRRSTVCFKFLRCLYSCTAGNS